MEKITKLGASSSRSRNRKIDLELVTNISHYSPQGAAAIQWRIKELDKSWDIEKTLEVNAGLLGLTGAVLALTVDKRWVILPAVVSPFLIHHPIQGWCPPLPLFKLMGIKSRPEFDREKYALKALREGFVDVHNATQGGKRC